QTAAGARRPRWPCDAIVRAAPWRPAPPARARPRLRETPHSSATRLTTVPAAILPIRASGCRTVVSGGLCEAAPAAGASRERLYHATRGAEAVRGCEHPRLTSPASGKCTKARDATSWRCASPRTPSLHRQQAVSRTPDAAELPKEGRSPVKVAVIFLATALCAAAANAQSTYDRHVAFDNSLTTPGYYYSDGDVVPPSELELVNGKLPVEASTCVTPPNCLRLIWRSGKGGDWRVTLNLKRHYGGVDLSGDTLSFWAYS